MEDCISRKSPGDVLVIGIDTNAALGVRTKEDGDNYCTGWHGLHRVNAAGRRLQLFLLRHRLLAASTCFKHYGRYGTWMHPQTKRMYQHDHFLVGRGA